MAVKRWLGTEKQVCKSLGKRRLGGPGQPDCRGGGEVVEVKSQRRPGVLVGRLGLDDGNHEIACVTKEVVGPFLGEPANFVAGYKNSAVGERFLLADLVITPAGGVQLGQNVLPAGVGFSNHVRRALLASFY